MERADSEGAVGQQTPRPDVLMESLGAEDEHPQSTATASCGNANEPPATSAASTEVAEDEGRPTESASFLQRVLDEGHERAERDFCAICFLSIEIPEEMRAA